MYGTCVRCLTWRVEEMLRRKFQSNCKLAETLYLFKPFRFINLTIVVYNCAFPCHVWQDVSHHRPLVRNQLPCTVVHRNQTVGFSSNEDG